MSAGTREVAAGVFAGRRIRTARKAGPCQYGRVVVGGPPCGATILPGDEYIEGEVDVSKAGGFGCERWCMAHAGAGE